LLTLTFCRREHEEISTPPTSINPNRDGPIASSAHPEIISSPVPNWDMTLNGEGLNSDLLWKSFYHITKAIAESGLGCNMSFMSWLNNNYDPELNGV